MSYLSEKGAKNVSVILGLTGGIATGKTTVAKLFEARGADLIDTDIIAKNVLTNPTTLKELRSVFGHTVFDDETLNRKKLAQVIYSSDDLRKSLNAIVHPKVKKRVKDKLKILQSNDDSLIVIEVPLLFEAGFDDLCDKTLVVYTSKAIQLERLMDRDSINREYAQKKINAQMPLEDKKKRADYLIDNSKSKEDTLEQVDAILKKVGE